MQPEVRQLALALSSAALLTLAGCGGGSGSSDSALPDALTLSGKAASGAAFTGAVITVIDATGATVGTSEPVGDDGRYSVTLATGARAPFVLIASREGAPGETQALVSVLDSAESATVNITPVTHLIASRLADSGDPLRLAGDLASGRAQIGAANVAAAVADIRRILAPVLAATGTSETDPLKASFAVDGTGYDRLLDSIRVEIIPAGAGSSNIEIGIRQTGADDTAPPPVIQFSSTHDVATITTANAISSAAVGGKSITSDTLVAPGTSALIARLLQGLNDCYALPTGTRVDRVGAAGTAANIVAEQCRSVFTGNDPAGFRNNGATVGGGLNKPFRGMFFDSGTGTVFSQGAYEYTRPSDGRILVSYRARSADGDETFGAFMARTEDGTLKLVGNGYDYPAEVVPSQQLRQQITLAQEPFSYYSTGYNLSVANLTQSGVPIFDRVEVTTPRGKVLTLRPRQGRSQLVLQYDYLPNPTGSKDAVNGLSNTGELRLRSEYVDASTPATPSPQVKESARLYFANPASFPDDASIESLSAQSLWTFRYYLAADPGTLAAAQTIRTRTRPLSIRELRYQGLMALDDATLARLRSASNPAGTPPEGQSLLPGSAPLAFAWTVPDRALPPTSAALFGLLAGTTTPFDDGVRFGSNDRSAQIACPAGDAQCHPTVDGAWAAGTYMNGLSFGSIDATGRSFSMYYSMAKLNPGP